MLDKLNKNQRDLVNEVKQEYIGLETKQWRDDKEIEKQVKNIYQIYQLKKEPEVYIFDSPIECQEFLNGEFLHIYTRGKGYLIEDGDNSGVNKEYYDSYWASINRLERGISEETEKLFKDINKVADLGNITRIQKGFIKRLHDRSREIMSVPFNILYDVKKRIDPQEKVLDQIFFNITKQIKANVDQDIINFIKDNIRKEINLHIIYDLPFANLLSDILREREKDKSKALIYFSSDVDKGYDLGLIAFYDYFKRIGMLNLEKEEDDIFDKFLDYIKSGIIYTVYLNRKAIISRNPLYIIRDDSRESYENIRIGTDVFRLRTMSRRTRLSNKEGPAIEWKNGDGLHFINGVYIDKELFKKIFIDNFNGEYSQIFSLRNVEHKAIAIQHIGYDKLLYMLHARKLDEWKTKSIFNGNLAICELFEFDIDRSTLRFVKVQDHSTGKVTALGVPVIQDTETAKGAVAWTFGLKEEEYNPIIET